MRALFAAALIATLGACTDPGKDNGARSAVPAPVMDPFHGLPLHYDGYYRYDIGEVIYLIRFFPEGRAVLINGTKDVEADLPKFLVRNTKGSATMGLYNVAPQVRGDSLFFTTYPENGEIDYRGNVVDGSLVRLYRYSHITGSKQMMEYIFYPDPPVGPEPASQ